VSAWFHRAQSSAPQVAQDPDLLLSVQGLVKRFGPVHAVDGFDLEVRPGEICGLVGPDGAGKTTTLRLVLGLMHPDAGRCLVLGRDVQTGGASVRSQMGYLSQAYALYGDLSVEENLSFFGHLFGLSRREYKKRRDRLLAITDLTEFTSRPAGALSGGMYKKLALACALLHEPKLLVLDEPTNGVDPVSRLQLWELVAEFASQSMGVLVSTPLMEEAARCHRVSVMHRGRSLVEGRPQNLVADLADHTFRLHVADAPDSAQKLEPVVMALSVESRTSLRVVVRSGEEHRLRALAAELDARMEPAAASFEDRFILSVVQAEQSAGDRSSGEGGRRDDGPPSGGDRGERDGR